MHYIHWPSGLTGFRNSMTTIEMAQSGREVYLLHGELERGEVPFCPACGQKMHIHGSRITMLRRLCFGSRLSAVSFEKRRYRCPCCGHTEMESVPFKADGHNITRELFQFTRRRKPLNHTQNNRATAFSAARLFCLRRSARIPYCI